MKKILQNAKKLMGPMVLICLLTVMLSACQKSINTTTNSKGVAALSVINACPDGPAVDFYIGSSQVTNTPLGLGNFTYYFSAYSGQSTALFYLTGTKTVEAQLNLNLTESNYYTLFLANVKATPDVLLLKDSVFKPATGSTAVRFVNVSPDAPNVDLYIKGGTKIAANVPYKTATVFINIPLPSGTGLDTLEVVQTGTTTVLATVPSISFLGTADYTIWFYGLANTTAFGEGLNAGIMENVYFNN